MCRIFQNPCSCCFNGLSVSPWPSLQGRELEINLPPDDPPGNLPETVACGCENKHTAQIGKNSFQELIHDASI